MIEPNKGPSVWWYYAAVYSLAMPIVSFPLTLYVQETFPKPGAMLYFCEMLVLLTSGFCGCISFWMFVTNYPRKFAWLQPLVGILASAVGLCLMAAALLF